MSIEELYRYTNVKYGKENMLIMETSIYHSDFQSVLQKVWVFYESITHSPTRKGNGPRPGFYSSCSALTCFYWDCTQYYALKEEFFTKSYDVSVRLSSPRMHCRVQ